MLRACPVRLTGSHRSALEAIPTSLSGSYRWWTRRESVQWRRQVQRGGNRSLGDPYRASIGDSTIAILAAGDLLIAKIIRD